MIYNKDIEDLVKSKSGELFINNASFRTKADCIYPYLEEECRLQNKDWDFTKDKHARILKITRAIESRSKLRKEIDIENWRKKCFMQLISIGKEYATPNPVGRPQKRLSDQLGKKTEDKLLNNIINVLEQTAKSEGISKFNLLKRVNKRCHELWNEQDVENERDHHDMLPEDATALIYNLNFLINQYQELRMFLLNFSTTLPLQNDVDKHKVTLIPPIIVEETKASCNINELIAQTLSAILNLESTIQLDGKMNISVNSKFGLDGSGSHQIRHQFASENDNTDSEEGNNYIGAFWCPLEVKANDTIIWTNPLPNSILYTRPVCLMREKENRISILQHFQPYIAELKSLETEHIQLNGEHNVNVITEVSMIDGKMTDFLQGDSGSFCHYCKVTRKEANDISLILQQTFKTSKSFEEITRIWAALESGEMSYTDPDRAGQCHAPMTEKDLKFFAILHQKLRSLDHCLKLMYHLVSGQTHTWSESNKYVKDAVSAAKMRLSRS